MISFRVELAESARSSRRFFRRLLTLSRYNRGTQIDSTSTSKERFMNWSNTARANGRIKIARLATQLVTTAGLLAVLTTTSVQAGSPTNPEARTVVLAASATAPVATPNAPAAALAAPAPQALPQTPEAPATAPVSAPPAPPAAIVAPAPTKLPAGPDSKAEAGDKAGTKPGADKQTSPLPTVLTQTLPAVTSPALPATATDLPAITAASSNFHNANPHVEEMFRAGLLNTLKQAAKQPDGTIYVGTGDIFAEWLRDSSAQVRPYLYFAKSDPAVAAFIRGVIARQMKYISIDPYANAFKADYAADPIHERKFELDSLAYPVILAWTYWKVTGDDSIFTPDFGKAMVTVLDTLTAEQDHPKNSKYTHFALVNNGKGPEVGYTGMIWTGFRPSDDNCVYNFLIPSEMMAVVALGDLAEIEGSFYHDQQQADRASSLRNDVHEGIQQFGIVHDAKFGNVYAYEVDGRGNFLLEDDANIPSLLSAPYLGYVKASDPIYRNTRKMILSSSNPNFAVGKIGSGIGSEHTPKGYIWPLALIMQGMTATSQKERQDMLDELIASDPGDHVLHESFNPDDPKVFTRKDFGWPNALFSEFMLVYFGNQAPLPTPSMKDLKFRTP